MNIRCHNSSSRGNLYTITDGRTNLLLECGIAYQKVLKVVDFKLSEYAGCLVSHEHGDHAKAIREILGSAINVYTSKGTAEALSLKSHWLHIIESKKSVTVGSFTILPFEIQHDAAEPLGFLIYSNHLKEKLLFATDTYYIKYRFSGLDYLMIECNYDLDILNSNVEAGKLPQAHKNRVLKSHMSLGNLVKYLQAIDLSKVRQIYLLHLSDGNSNERLFKETIENEFYRPVTVCPA